MFQTPADVHVPLPGRREGGGRRPRQDSPAANRPSLPVSSLSRPTGVQSESYGPGALPGREAHRVRHHQIRHQVMLRPPCSCSPCRTDSTRLVNPHVVLLCRFGAGDVVNMRPCNAAEDVEQFCQLLRLEPEARFTLSATDAAAGTCVCLIHDSLIHREEIHD